MPYLPVCHLFFCETYSFFRFACRSVQRIQLNRQLSQDFFQRRQLYLFHNHIGVLLQGSNIFFAFIDFQVNLAQIPNNIQPVLDICIMFRLQRFQNEFHLLQSGMNLYQLFRKFLPLFPGLFQLHL